MRGADRTRAGSLAGVGFAWVLEVVHEIVHAHSDPNTACHYVPGDASDPAPGDLCPAMTRETSARLSETLGEAGLDVAEQVEPARFLFPSMDPRQHVMVLPLAWDGRTAGILVVAAATPPLGKAGLTRVTRLASHGLGWVRRVGDTTDGLVAAATEQARLDAELEATRMFLELQETLVAARTTAEVISALAGWLGAPVALQMRNLMVAEAAGAGAGAGAGAHDLALSSRRGEVEREVIIRANTDGRIQIVPAWGALPERVVAPIIGTNAELAGFLVAARGERGRDLTRRALGVSLGLISYQMSARQDLAASIASLRQTLLTDLLEKRFSTRLLARAAKLEHDLSATHIPLAIGTVDGTPLGGVQDLLLQLIERAGAQASAASAVTLLGVVDDMVVAFVPEPVPAGATALGQLIQDEATADGLTLVVGIGPACTRAEEMPAAATRARWTVQMLRAISGRRAGVAQFEDLGVYGLLFNEQRGGDLTGYATRWLGPLLDYDERHATELVETLRQVFGRRSLSEAAATLHIHVSTLTYRIRRIEQVLGRSLESWDDVFHLELALRLLSGADQLHAPATPQFTGR